jgi:arylsulfatase A-like enzyme
MIPSRLFTYQVLLSGFLLIACNTGDVSPQMDRISRIPLQTDLIPSDTAPGIILVSFDTLRADGLGCYGNPEAVSPCLDRFAGRSIQFAGEMVQLPGTLPSHMSILTSLYPRQHTVYPPDSILPGTIVTAAELFQQAGYATGGFTEGGYVSGKFGFNRGFDLFRDDIRGWDRILDAGIAFLKTIKKDRPFFLFLHTYQTHDPYFPPPEYKALFCRDEYVPRFEPTGPNLVAANQGRLVSTQEDADHFRNLYEAEIRFTDSICQALYNHLSREGLWDRAMVIFTSDHGEEFLEHGKFVHEQLYDPLLHVPLLVRTPLWKGSGLIPDLVQSIDILPAMLHYANIPIHKQLQGKSLLSTAWTSHMTGSSIAYSESFATHRAALQELQNGHHRKFLMNMPGMVQKQLAVGKDISIQVKGNRPTLKLAAYHSPRKVSVFWKENRITTLDVPVRWTSFPVDLPFPEKDVLVEIQLRCDGCDIPSQVSDSDDQRCLSMFIAKTDTVPLMKAEYYDLSHDPSEQINMLFDQTLHSENQRDISENWAKRLDQMIKTMEPQGQKTTLELDTKQIDELKALGYLQ